MGCYDRESVNLGPFRGTASKSGLGWSVGGRGFRTAATGRRIALLNFGNPYVMADLPRSAFSLCTFSDAPDSITAALAVLFGELKPKGRLPVRISARYPFGLGLKD